MPVLPPMPELQVLAARENQDIRAAIQTLQQANADVTIARAGFFPTFSLDAVYGIEANAIALHNAQAAAAARAEIDMFRDAADRAADSLRVTNLRYQAGEATALEIVMRGTLSQRRATRWMMDWLATVSLLRHCRR